MSLAPAGEEIQEGPVSLGATGLKVSALGTGAWAWGDRLYWGFGRGYNEADVRAAFQASREAGVNFFDTAESYGRGRSERLLGETIRAEGSREKIVIATKFFPYPWRLTTGQFLRALRGSLERLGFDQVDLYQVHWPFPPVSIETWMEAMAEAVREGLTRAVGVSNYNADQMSRAHAALAKHGLPLASNQVEYSLLNRTVERNGLLALCQQLRVRLIAYGPLSQGLLTGKYSPEHPPSGIRAMRYRPEILRRAQALVGLMGEIGRGAGDKSPAQVAINWTICKGTVPIPGAKNARQARENTGALGWRLSQADVAALDRAAEEVS